MPRLVAAVGVTRGHEPTGRPGGRIVGADKEDSVFRAIADVLRAIGGTLAAVVTLPFRALARLFSGASRGGPRRRRV